MVDLFYNAEYACGRTICKIDEPTSIVDELYPTLKSKKLWDGNESDSKKLHSVGLNEDEC